jgi:hypothetical protein
MSASPILSASASRELLSLAVAQQAIDGSSAPTDAGAVAQILQADQLQAVRSQLLAGETFSVTA